jgi:hypothetical protein
MAILKRLSLSVRVYGYTQPFHTNSEMPFFKYDWYSIYPFHFLGAFVKLCKATIIFVISVRMEHLRSSWTEFHEMCYLSIFPKSS